MGRLKIFLDIFHVTKFFPPMCYVVYKNLLIAFDILSTHQEVKGNHIAAGLNKMSWNKIRPYKFLFVLLCLLNKVVMLFILSM